MTFRNEILDGSLSRDLNLRDFTANCFNGERDLKCTSFFTLLSVLNTLLYTFVSESTAVLYCTEPGTAFKKPATRENFTFTLLWATDLSTEWFLPNILL